jgi:hypothetical protein
MSWNSANLQKNSVFIIHVISLCCNLQCTNERPVETWSIFYLQTMCVCCRSPCVTKLDVIALCEGFAKASLSLDVLVCCDIFRLECLVCLRFLYLIRELGSNFVWNITLNIHESPTILRSSAYGGGDFIEMGPQNGRQCGINLKKYFISELRFSRRCLWRMVSSGMLCRVALVVLSSPILVTLMKEAIGSSETSVLTRSTRRNIPEDTIIHTLYPLGLTRVKFHIRDIWQKTETASVV